MRAWAALLLAALALLLAAPPALAHASLVASEPADGASLDDAPRELVLRFDEPVDPMSTRLVDGSGRAVPLGASRLEGHALSVPVAASMTSGTYLFSYRVVSADSHPVAGAIAFSIGRAAPARSGGSAVAGAPGAPGAAAIVLRAARDIALLAAAGAALFLLLVGPFPGERRVLAVAGVAAAALSVLGIGVQGAAMVDASSLAEAGAWSAGWRSSFGASAGIATAGALAIGASAALRRPFAKTAAAALGALACAASLAMTGHAAAAQPRWLAGTSVAAHGLTAAFWFGSLLALHAVLRRDAAHALAALQRFSRIAGATVAVLLAAGVAFAALQLRSPAELVASRYGGLVLLKAALLALLLALAAANRFVLVPRLARGTPQAVPALRRTVAAEIAVVALVLAATALLVQTSPPEARHPVTARVESGGRAAVLTIDPARGGRNVVTASLSDAEGRPLSAAAVQLSLSNPEAGIEPVVRPMRAAAPGRYAHEGSELAFAGNWHVEIRARIDDFEQAAWRTTVRVRH